MIPLILKFQNKNFHREKVDQRFPEDWGEGAMENRC